MPYVARTKDAKQKLEPRAREAIKAVTLACGHQTDSPPPLSNPARWWCCDGWQGKRAR